MWLSGALNRLNQKGKTQRPFLESPSQLREGVALHWAFLKGLWETGGDAGAGRVESCEGVTEKIEGKEDATQDARLKELE